MGNPKEQCSSPPPPIFQEISSHPLFSILTTTSLLALLYFPHLLPLLFSPVLISTSLLLTTLLRFGNQSIDVSPAEELTLLEPKPDELEHKFESLLEWGRRGGPLEVIYEEFEGEDEDEDQDEAAAAYGGTDQKRLEFIGFYDTDDADSDSSSSSPLSENMRFRWEELEEGDGMIEIALEEDNLIEIDLRTCRHTGQEVLAHVLDEDQSGDQGTLKMTIHPDKSGQSRTRLSDKEGRTCFH